MSGPANSQPLAGTAVHRGAQCSANAVVAAAVCTSARANAAAYAEASDHAHPVAADPAGVSCALHGVSTRPVTCSRQHGHYYA